MALSTETLELVLATLRAPTRAFRLRERALPGDVLGVIRLAAGEAGALEEAGAASGLDEATLRESAAFFLQQALFHPEADAYRVLGAWPAIDDGLLKQHYRWLMHWLHPDRAANQDWSVFADRVSRAWNVLRTRERRANYDREHGVPTPGDDDPLRVLVTPRAAFEESVATPWLSGRAIRRLPGIVIGSLLLLTLAGIALVLHIERSQPPPGDWSAPSPAALPATPRAAARATAAAASAEREGAMPASMPAAGLAQASVPPLASAPVAASADGAPAAAETRPPVPTAAERAEPQSAPTVTVAPTAAPAGAAPSVAPAAEAAPPLPKSAVPAVAAPSSAAAALPAAPAPAPVAQAKPSASTAQVAPSAAVAPADQASAPAGRAAVAPPSPAPVAEATTAGAASAAGASPAPTPAQKAERTLQSMTDAYRRGDLDALMALFDSGARSELGDRDAIARDYRRLFASSSGRNLTLSDLTWLVEGSRATAFGRYEAVIVPRDGGTTQVVRGSLRVDVLLDADRPRILRLLHDGRAVR